MAKNLLREYGPGEVTVLELDSYYRDLGDLDLKARAAENFDHPNAIEIELLYQHLDALTQHNSIQVPLYNFATHTRMDETRDVNPHRVIIIEGIHALYFDMLRERMQLKVFVDTPADIRFIRRLRRDVRERGRSLDAVVDQYRKTVRNMHDQFVEPCKYLADIIIPEGGHNPVALDLLTTKIDSILQQT